MTILDVQEQLHKEKGMVPKPGLLVLHRNGFTTRRVDGRVTNYNYFEVESV